MAEVKMTLLCVVPTRNRRANCERMLKSFGETAGESTDILFITDPDDQDAYEGMDWGKAKHAILEPRGSFITKLNQGADPFIDVYDAFFAIGDSNVFITPGWDAIMMGKLAKMGGSGWVYPENGRRRDIPESWLTSADVVKELNWLAPPCVGMYYGDNIIAELGKRAGLIRYCPEAVIEHRHYSVFKETPYDNTYREAETTWGELDYKSYQQWRAEQMPIETAQLRRNFNPDLKWVFSRF
jgi:hypothetical protein